MRRWEDYLEDLEIALPGTKAHFRELPRVAVVGSFQNGKSTFINCLLGRRVARLGDGRVTTKLSSRYRWGGSLTFELRTRQGLRPISASEFLHSSVSPHFLYDSAFQAEVAVPSPILRKVEIVDTPGFEANAQDTQNVSFSLGEADYAIVVLQNSRALRESDFDIFECVASKQIPFSVIMNCKHNTATTEWYPSHRRNLEIIQANASILQTWGYVPEAIADHLIYPCNLLWYWLATRGDQPQSKEADTEKDLLALTEFALARNQEAFSNENMIEISNFSAIEDFLCNRLAVKVQ